MPDKELDELIAAVRSDDADRADWKNRQDEWRRIRLCEDTRRKLPYPGAPDLREPLIDDIVTQLTSVEISILWSARTLAVFQPRKSDGMPFKRMAEVGFDAMLRQTLQLRGKLENLFDLKNERGMAVAKLIETELPSGEVLPDFLPLEPEKVIVPTCTTHIRDAERVCHEIPMSRRVFLSMAKKRGWNNAQKILDRLAEKETGKTGEPVVQGADEIGSSVSDVVVWEIYHWSNDGRKLKTIVARDWPDEKIDESEWKWPDTPQVTGVDPITQTPIVSMIPGKMRPWPFVQFRYSNRTLRYYDIRGCTEKLKHDQNMAIANLNAKGVLMDFCCKPFIKGATNVSGFRWRPGEKFPDNGELVTMPRIDSIFDYNVDLARAGAARRVGAPNGAMSSVDKTRDTKTATEVSTTAMQNNQYSSDAVERFAEPLAELFTMMWDWCRENKPKLSGIQGNSFIDIPEQVYGHDFIVQAGISGRSANPDLILRQLNMLTQMFGMNPSMQQSVRGAELAKLIFDQIDPKITDLVVVDPQAQGPQGQAPLEQTVAQIMQLLKGGKNQQGEDEQGLVEQVVNHDKYLTAIAQHDAAGGSAPQGEGE